MKAIESVSLANPEEVVARMRGIPWPQDGAGLAKVAPRLHRRIRAYLEDSITARTTTLDFRAPLGRVWFGRQASDRVGGPEFNIFPESGRGCLVSIGATRFPRLRVQLRAESWWLPPYEGLLPALRQRAPRIDEVGDVLGVIDQLPTFDSYHSGNRPIGVALTWSGPVDSVDDVVGAVGRMSAVLRDHGQGALLEFLSEYDDEVCASWLGVAELMGRSPRDVAIGLIALAREVSAAASAQRSPLYLDPDVEALVDVLGTPGSKVSRKEAMRRWVGARAWCAGVVSIPEGAAYGKLLAAALGEVFPDPFYRGFGERPELAHQFELRSAIEAAMAVIQAWLGSPVAVGQRVRRALDLTDD